MFNESLGLRRPNARTPTGAWASNPATWSTGGGVTRVLAGRVLGALDCWCDGAPGQPCEREAWRMVAESTAIYSASLARRMRQAVPDGGRARTLRTAI